jgi:hypothetical protein
MVHSVEKCGGGMELQRDTLLTTVTEIINERHRKGTVT